MGMGISGGSSRDLIEKTNELLEKQVELIKVSDRTNKTLVRLTQVLATFGILQLCMSALVLPIQSTMGFIGVGIAIFAYYIYITLKN